MDKGVNNLVYLLGEGIDSIVRGYPVIRHQFNNERIITSITGAMMVITVAILAYVMFMEYVLNISSAGETYGLHREENNRKIIENYLKRRKFLITLGVFLFIVIVVGDTLNIIYNADYLILRQLLG